MYIILSDGTRFRQNLEIVLPVNIFESNSTCICSLMCFKTWMHHFFDLAPPSGQTGGPNSRKYFDRFLNASVSAVSDAVIA